MGVFVSPIETPRADALAPPVSLPANLAACHDAESIVLRIVCADDIVHLKSIHAERIAWVETDMALAEDPALAHMALDVLLTNLETQAPHLYRLARLHADAPLRITIPLEGHYAAAQDTSAQPNASAGLEKAVTIAMALGLPVRILPGQPSPASVSTLERLLDRYLHDINAFAPVEMFHSLLVAFLQDEPTTTLWQITEDDTELFTRVEPKDSTQKPSPRVPLDILIAEHRECARCPFQSPCAGYFKWPDATYDCTDVRRLLTRIADSALQLHKDVAQLRDASVAKASPPTAAEVDAPALLRRPSDLEADSAVRTAIGGDS